MNNLIIGNRAPTDKDEANFRFWIDSSVSPWRVYENKGDKWEAK